MKNCYIKQEILVTRDSSGKYYHSTNTFIDKDDGRMCSYTITTKQFSFGQENCYTEHSGKHFSTGKACKLYATIVGKNENMSFIRNCEPDSELIVTNMTMALIRSALRNGFLPSIQYSKENGIDRFTPKKIFFNNPDNSLLSDFVNKYSEL